MSKGMAVLCVGYHRFIIPDTVKIDALRGLVNAVRVEENGTKLYKTTEDGRIEIKIVPGQLCNGLVRYMGDSEFRELANFAAEKLRDRSDLPPIVFDSDSYKIDGKKFDYPNIQDPEFDPEKWVEEIVSKAEQLGQ